MILLGRPSGAMSLCLDEGSSKVPVYSSGTWRGNADRCCIPLKGGAQGLKGIRGVPSKELCEPSQSLLLTFWTCDKNSLLGILLSSTVRLLNRGLRQQGLFVLETFRTII